MKLTKKERAALNWAINRARIEQRTLRTRAEVYETAYGKARADRQRALADTYTPIIEGLEDLKKTIKEAKKP